MSRQVLDLVKKGIPRDSLMLSVPNYRGAPLEDLEGKKYHYWLIDRYEDEQGRKCLKLNDLHLIGDFESDKAARVIRRKARAVFSNEKAKQGRVREPKSLAELNHAQREYLLALGDAANDVLERKIPTED
jgi:hypothetical protein